MKKDRRETSQVLTILYAPGELHLPLFMPMLSLSQCHDSPLPYLHHLFPLCRGEPLSLVQVDLGLVEPGADVSQVLIKDFHFILVTLHTCNQKPMLSVSIRI